MLLSSFVGPSFLAFASTCFASSFYFILFYFFFVASGFGSDGSCNHSMITLV